MEMVTAFGMLIALMMAGLIGWVMSANTGPPDEERYCLKCGKATSWHPYRGCRECYWADQQW